MKKLLAIFAAVVTAGAIATTAAAGPPPSYLCTRATLGVVMGGTGDGHLYRCSVRIRFVGPYALATYYWLDIGFPALAET